MIASSLNVSTQIRRRARLYAVASWLLLATIVSSLFVGAMLFRAAGDLVFDDAEKASALRRMAVDELAQREEALAQQVKNLTERLEVELSGVGGPLKGEGPNAARIRAEIDFVKRDRDSVRLRLSEAYREPEWQAKVELLSPQFLTSTATRIAILFALILLLRVLAGLHIYTIRISAHFHTVADAVELNLYSPSVENLVPLIQAMSAHRVGFPGVKEHPVDSVREILSVANLTGSNAGKALRRET